jgi:shikimate dehydrogenase
VECTEAVLAARLRALADEGLAGVSLTMPLKRAVMPLLAAVDERAGLVGGANTVLFDAASGWRGANTDVPGMVAALGDAVGAERACVLGAGATAAAAIAALAECAVAGVEVIARRPEAAAELGALAAVLGIEFALRPWEELAEAAASPLVISTTPAGSSDALVAALQSTEGVLFDVIYAPWPTPLATAWAAAGGRVIGGLELLVEQAALQVALMTGLEPPVAVMREAGYAALGR